MRNLKRALSLALASVMLLGMMVVGTSASYTDVSSKNNQEAIEVLQAVGVMVGDEKGNFNPDQKVTRNEMAVIMANLMDYTVASYKGTSPFTDVPEWAEPYVAACYTNGIIAGYSATTFGGNDTVTTGQAALMLLKALGYFEYQSDFGSDWLVETTKQGAKIDLFDGVDTGAREALTRNDVAQLVLNALEADCVESDGQGGVTVEGDGFTVTTGKATYNSRTGTADKYSKIVKENKSENGGKYTIQLGEDLFGGDLEKKDTNGDDFRRPASTWKYKTSEIGTYADSPDYTYLNKVTKGTLYTDIGKNLVDDIKDGYNTIKVYVDGKEVEYVDGAAAVANLMVSNSSGHIDDAKGNHLTGNGVSTEVYIDDEDNVTICIINTYVMQATGDYNTSKETLNVENKVGPSTESKLELEDFDTLASYAEDDYILYTYAANEIQTIAKAEIVEGEVVSMVKDSVNLDGTTYKYAKAYVAAYGQTGEGEDTDLNRFTTEETAAIVVDENGFLIWIDNSAVSAGSYVYVDAAETASLGKVAEAGVYTADGLYQKVEVKKVKFSGGSDTTNATEMAKYLDAHGGWYSYTKDSSDRYTLTETKTSATFSSKTKDQKVIVGESVKFLGVEAKIGEKTDNTVRADNNTIFVVDDGDDVNVYVGAKNAPTIVVKDGEVYGSYIRVEDKATKNYATLVFVNAENASVDETNTAEELMFVAKLDSTYKDSNDTVYKYKVVLGGEEQIVEAADKLTVGEVYYKIKRDSDDRITDQSKLFTDSTDQKYRHGNLTADEVDYSNGSLMLGDDAFTVEDDAEIVLVLMKGSGDVMTDVDADYEANCSISARALDSILNNYKVTGSYYGITTESDNDILSTLYVVITGSTEA